MVQRISAKESNCTTQVVGASLSKFATIYSGSKVKTLILSVCNKSSRALFKKSLSLLITIKTIILKNILSFTKPSNSLKIL